MTELQTTAVDEDQIVDKETLFTRRIKEDDVKIPGLGKVRVRALTRDEGLEVTGKELPRKRLERMLVATAMVNPRMTEEEVGTWQRNSGAGEIKLVVDKIQQLSGLTEDAAKSDVLADGESA
jgi:hypothetical protein